MTTGRCELCQREGVELTRHHLIPRSTHQRRRIRRQFDRSRREHAILHVCRACHKQIHALIPEMELALRYHSREALLSHPELARFVAWISRRPPGYVPRTHSRRGPH